MFAVWKYEGKAMQVIRGGFGNLLNKTKKPIRNRAQS